MSPFPKTIALYLLSCAVIYGLYYLSGSTPDFDAVLGAMSIFILHNTYRILERLDGLSSIK